MIVLRCYSKGRYGRRQSQWFTYAAYGVEQIPLGQIFDLDRRRFGMESGYRQMHQLRARTTSPNPTLRLLLVGLALLRYNRYLLLRQVGCATHNYGQRLRVIWLSLDRLRRLLQRFIEQRLGAATLQQVLVPWITPLSVS